MAVSQRVQVTRAFRVGGEDIGVGSVISIDQPTAIELRTGRKVVWMPNDAALVKKPLEIVERRSNRANQSEIPALRAEVAELKALIEKMAPAKAAKGSQEKANA